MGLIEILLIILLLSFLFGGWSTWRGGGGWGWSPLGVILLVLVVLWLAGRL